MNSLRHPNVLFITVDALRTDRLSLHGYQRSTTPNLDAMASTSLITSETTSNAAFTQPSLPSLLTSSYPLSCGGYDRGAIGRPDSLFKVMHQAGYHTTILSTFPWINQFYGYQDGVSEEHLLFVINALVGVASQTMASTLVSFRSGIVPYDEMITHVRPILFKLFDDLGTYCEERLTSANSDRQNFSNDRLFTNGYNYQKILNIISKHRRMAENNIKNYVEQYFPDRPNERNWISREWRLARHAMPLLHMSFERMLSKIIGPVLPSTARLLEFNSKRYIDSHSLANFLINKIKARSGDKPFFMWTHFLDTHVPYCPGAGPKWRERAKHHLHAIGYDPELDLSIGVKKRPESDSEWATWNALYDASVHYVDSEIGRVLEALNACGLADSTLVVISSDHGEELGEHGDVSHHFRLYEHNIRVPMIFRGPGVSHANNSDLTTMLDIAPTITDFANIAAPSDWAGKSVLSTDVKDRDHVIAESFHGGNCLFEHRPPYIAVRTKSMKYLWKEYRDLTDHFSDESPELYNHINDPLEQNNLYHPDHPDVAGLNRIVANRLSEIPEFSPARIKRALPQTG